MRQRQNLCLDLDDRTGKFNPFTGYPGACRLISSALVTRSRGGIFPSLTPLDPYTLPAHVYLGETALASVAAPQGRERGVQDDAKDSSR